jgi:hypothetical protein
MLVGVAGLAIDYARAIDSHTKLQALADSAALAGASDGASELEDRVTYAKNFLKAAGPQKSNLSAKVTGVDVTGDAATNTVVVKITASQDLALLKILGFPGTDVSATASASSGRGARVLDVAMCIDATGSMQPILDAVTNEALNFANNLNQQLANQSLPPVDSIHVRPIFFRDFGGNNPTGRGRISGSYTVASGGNVDKFPNGTQWRAAGDGRNYGDDVPMRAAPGFFDLYDQATDFRDFVLPEVESGGGDYPESGLECLNEAMDSPWTRTGDIVKTANGPKPATDVMSLIVVWTDEDAQPPGFATSLLNPSYPIASKMPRDYTGLEAKWLDSSVIPQEHKMLAMFGPESGYTDGWDPIMAWNNFLTVGSLRNGTTDLVGRLATVVGGMMPANRSAALTK